jgi:acetyl esterase/lipase
MHISAVECWDDTVDPDPWPRGQYVPSGVTFERVIAPGLSQPLTAQGTKTDSSTSAVTNFTTPLVWDGERKYAEVDGPHDWHYYSQATSGGTLDWMTTVYKPNEDDFPGPHPIVVWVHGGFFVQGSRWELFYDWARQLCAAGYIVVSPEYPHASQPGVGPSNPSTDQRTRHPKQIQFIKKLTHEIMVQFPALFNGDPDKIILAGHSAGSYLATAAALSANQTIGGYNTRMNAFFGGSDPDPVVAGTFGYATPVNFQQVFVDDVTGFTSLVTPRAYMGRNISEEIYNFCLPACMNTWIGSSTPNIPIRLLHGSGDILITPPHANSLHDAYVAAGKGSLFTEFTVDAGHDNIMKVDDPNSSLTGIIPWANAVTGGPP